MDVARVQIIASTECDPHDAYTGALLSSANPTSGHTIDKGLVPVEDQPALLSQEGRRVGKRPEETLDALRAVCTTAPAWMIEVRAAKRVTMNQEYRV
jgi:hypothetical protein